MAAISEERRAHLLTFDRLEELPSDPPPAATPTACKKIISAIGCIGSIGLRMANLSLWTNALGSFGAGFAALSTITSGENAETLARIRQVALPLVGQMAVFSFAQAWANDPNRAHQIVFDNTIIALFGANIQLIIGFLLQQGAIRTESHSPRGLEIDGHQKLNKPSWLNQNWIHALKLLASGGFGAGSFLSKDTLLQPISSYFFSFFLSQVVGERMIDKTDGKIAQTDTGQGSVFRKVKTAVLTTAYVGQTLGFIFMPWRQTTPDEQMVNLRCSGALLGLCDGVLDRSLSRRVENLPVEDLEELKKLPPPEKGGWKYRAYRIWQIAVPTIAISGIIGFTVWQNNFVLEDKEAKIGLGSMLTGFLSGSAFCHAVDKLWDPHKREAMRDRLITALWYSPRFYGVDPIFLYYALINAVKMDAAAIDSQTNQNRLAALFFAWFFYGGRMAHELFIASSPRIGNAQIKRNTMALFNAAMTTSYYLTGYN